MAQAYFFAAADDVTKIFDFIFEHTDFRVLDRDSPRGQKIREYRSTADILALHKFCDGNETRYIGSRFNLWSPSVVDQSTIRRIDFNPGVFEGGPQFRYIMEGGGLIVFSIGLAANGTVTRSQLGSGSEQWAKAWEKDQGVDWDGLRKLERKILYHVQTRMPVAKVNARPILPGAYRFALEGFTFKESPGCAWSYDLTTMTVKNPGKSGPSIELTGAKD